MKKYNEKSIKVTERSKEDYKYYFTDILELDLEKAEELIKQKISERKEYMKDTITLPNEKKVYTFTYVGVFKFLMSQTPNIKMKSFSDVNLCATVNYLTNHPELYVE